jgi:hypothetical protein
MPQNPLLISAIAVLVGIAALLFIYIEIMSGVKLTHETEAAASLARKAAIDATIGEQKLGGLTMRSASIDTRGNVTLGPVPTENTDAEPFDIKEAYEQMVVATSTALKDKLNWQGLRKDDLLAEIVRAGRDNTLEKKIVRTLLNFLGLSDIKVFRAEATPTRPENIAAAKIQIAALAA